MCRRFTCRQSAGGWEAPKRLAGWRKVDIKKGAGTDVELRVDPRLLAVFSETDNAWRIAPGKYQVMLGSSAADLKLETTIELRERRLPAGWKPAPVQATARNSH